MIHCGKFSCVVLSLLKFSLYKLFFQMVKSRWVEFVISNLVTTLLNLISVASGETTDILSPSHFVEHKHYRNLLQEFHRQVKFGLIWPDPYRNSRMAHDSFGRLI